MKGLFPIHSSQDETVTPCHHVIMKNQRNLQKVSAALLLSARRHHECLKKLFPLRLPE